MDTLLDTLNSNQVVLSSGFAAGFVYAFKLSKRTLNYPLTTLFESALQGMLTLFGTSYIIDFFPENFRFIIPCTIAASCIFWKYNDLFHNKKNKPFFKFKYTTTNSVTNITVGDDEEKEEDSKKD